MKQNPETELPKEARVKTLIALLDQENLENPTINILLNTLGFTPVMVRDDTAGRYLIRPLGKYPKTKTTIMIGRCTNANGVPRIKHEGNETILETYNASNSVLTDNILKDTAIEIKIYE